MPTTEYLWDDETDTVVMEIDGSDTTQAVYNSDPVHYGRLFSMRRNGQTYNFRYDAQGNTRALTDQNGDITDTYTYDAWGNQRTQSGITDNSYRFVGQQGYQHNESGDTNYIRARFYEPKQGRWTTCDPNYFSDGTNRFIYVVNDPTSATDPSGLKVNCLADCHRPDDWLKAQSKPGGPGAALHSIIHEKNRGTVVSARILNATKPNLFQSSFMAAVMLKNKSDIDKWWEKTEKKPQSRDDCCCCCTDVKWINFFVFKASGSKEAIDFLKIGKLHPLRNTAYIDKSIPYTPNNRSFYPCKEQEPTKRWTIGDGPGYPGIKDFLDKGGEFYQQLFHSCVYCVGGPEAYQKSKLGGVFFVSYCCIDWGHQIDKKRKGRRGGPFVTRVLGKKKGGEWAEHKTWPLEGDNLAANRGKRSLSVKKAECVPMSGKAAEALRAGRIWIGKVDKEPEKK